MITEDWQVSLTTGLASQNAPPGASGGGRAKRPGLLRNRVKIR